MSSSTTAEALKRLPCQTSRRSNLSWDNLESLIYIRYNWHALHIPSIVNAAHERISKERAAAARRRYSSSDDDDDDSSSSNSDNSDDSFGSDSDEVVEARTTRKRRRKGSTC
jgi:hypothetical protein